MPHGAEAMYGSPSYMSRWYENGEVEVSAASLRVEWNGIQRA